MVIDLETNAHLGIWEFGDLQTIIKQVEDGQIDTDTALQQLERRIVSKDYQIMPMSRGGVPELGITEQDIERFRQLSPIAFRSTGDPKRDLELEELWIASMKYRFEQARKAQTKKRTEDRKGQEASS